MNKSFSGIYSQGGTAGIYIYDDGTFALVAYATLITGHYAINNNRIDFIPAIPNQIFAVLGRENKSIKTGIKLTFAGEFNDDSVYLKFDNDSLMNIFDKNYAEGRAHYTTELAYHPKMISLSQNFTSSLYKHNTNTFNMNNKFNDFMLFYNKETSAQEPFSATLKDENGEIILQSDWGNFDKETDGGDIEMKNYLDKSRDHQRNDINKTLFYFNDQLKSAKGFDHLSEEFSVFSIKNYVLDEASNKFIHKDVYRKGKDYSNSVVKDYHDESIILQYRNIDVSEKLTVNFGEIKINPKALFASD